MGLLTGTTVLAATVLAAATTARAADFTLTSPDFSEGGTLKLEQVFNNFGCKGQNISPALSWSGVPAGTKSLALTVFDPDAPTGSGFWHWVIANMAPDTKGLPKNAGNPEGHMAPRGSITVRNDYSVHGYGGPCPPPGPAHHYVFTLYAVDQDLPINADVSAAVVGFNLHFHTIAKATLTGMYGQ